MAKKLIKIKGDQGGINFSLLLFSINSLYYTYEKNNFLFIFLRLVSKEYLAAYENFILNGIRLREPNTE